MWPWEWSRPHRDGPVRRMGRRSTNRTRRAAEERSGGSASQSRSPYEGRRASLPRRHANPASEIMVMVSALCARRGPFSVELSAKPATNAALPSLASDGPAGTPKSHAVRPRRPRRGQLIGPRSRRGGCPAKDRVFHMLVRDGDVYSPSNYRGDFGCIAGRRTAHPGVCGSEDLDSVRADTVSDIIQTFDDRIFPDDVEPIRAGRRRRRRRAVHGPAVELARSPGRRPLRGRWIRQGGRSRPGVSIAAGQSMRHDVPEHALKSGPLPSDRAGA